MTFQYLIHVVLSLCFVAACDAADQAPRKTGPAPNTTSPSTTAPERPPTQPAQAADASAKKLQPIRKGSSFASPEDQMLNSNARPSKGGLKRKSGAFKVQGTYAEVLKRTDDELVQLKERQAKEKTPSWLTWEKIAQVHLKRAQLTGQYEPYLEAEKTLQKAFDIAPEKSGPLRTRASLHLSTHRVNKADADLKLAEGAAIVMDKPHLMGLRAEYDFHLGRYNEARTGFETALSQDKTNFRIRTRLAIWHWKTGDFEKAETIFAEAGKNYHGRDPHVLAWLHLQFGLLDLDRGRLDDARAHYEAANQALSGWWLIEEHIAEIDTLQGKTEVAHKAYLDLVERTNNPEFMDALAELLAETGKSEESQQWVKRARKRYDEQLAMLPEASYGHALEHFLAFGDAAEALALAKKNVALRAGAEAHILLAQAHLKAGETAAAKAAIDHALGTPWRSVDLFVTAQAVYQTLGDQDQAKKHCTSAKQIDPNSCKP